MTMDYVIRPWERELFLGCRRAWDFGAHERQGLEPAAPDRVMDLGQAVKDALAVYYFPGMWDWSRAIVAPLATAGFDKALGAGPSEAAASDGRRLLAAYYDWAPAADRWSTVQVETLFDVTVPDPARPGSGLLAADGRGVLYRMRIDLVVVDKAGRNWLVAHRLCEDGFAEMHDLLLDDIALTRAWGWEQGFLGKVAGTIHNELRLPRPGEPGPEDAPPPDRPPIEWIKTGGRHVRRYNGFWFRRTRIRRSRAEIDGAGARVAEQCRLMAAAEVEPYPTPEWSTCLSCHFRDPCLALMQGEDPGPVLAEHHRPRVRRDFEEGRLGSVWGYVPHRPDQTHVRLNPPERRP